MFDISPVLNLIYRVTGVIIFAMFAGLVAGLLARNASKKRRLAIVNLVFVLTVVIGGFVVLL